VLDGEVELVPDRLTDRYPDDAMACEMGLVSYLGAPLPGTKGEPIGILAVTHERPLDLPYWTRPVMGSYAARLAAELQRADAFEALRERERRYRQLAEMSRDLIVTHDMEGRITYANPAVLQALGVSEQELVGRNVLDFATEESRALQREQHVQRLEGHHGPLRYEADFVRPDDGEIVRLEIVSTVLVEQNEPTGVLAIGRDVTERRHTLRALRASRKKYKELVHALPDIVFEIDLDGRLTFANRTGLERFGWTADDVASGIDAVAALAADDIERARENLARIMQGETLGWLDYEAETTSGERFPISVHAQPIMAGDRVIGARGIAVDNTHRAEAEAELALAASVFENSSEGIIITDQDGTILRANRAATHITGYQRDELLGQNASILQSGRHDSAFFETMWSVLWETGSWHGELYNRRKNGETYPQWTSISAVRSENDDQTHFISVFNDVSAQKRFEERIHRLSHFDGLTDLPNRRLFQERLEHAVGRAQRRDGHVALIYLDIDRFKSINDSLGHTTGDRLLVEVADRLRQAVRETDTVARLGGDEFTIILSGFDSHSDAVNGAVRVARDVAVAVRAPMVLEKHEVAFTASIGIAFYPNDADTAHDLVMNADTAMYHAKESGRNDYRFYAQRMNARAKARLIMENRLRRAVGRGEFVLHYQPQVDVTTNRVCGYEALLRWQPDDRLVSPDEFMDLLEESGLIIDVGEWVLRSACEQLRNWAHQGRSHLRMAVNLSAKQFFQSNLPERVAGIIEEHGLDPSRIELEITESSLLGDEGNVMSALHDLKAIGVSISIDDFGTGYSSLSYLKRFPIDTVKVDRTFVEGIPHDSDDTAITGAILALASSLNLRVVAEGVETRAQLDFLKERGCHEYQGYLFERPLSAPEIDSLPPERQ